MEQLRLEAVFVRCSRDLYRYCRLVLGEDDHAREVVQSTLARALAELRDGEPPAALRPWLFHLAHDEAMLLLRARRLEELASPGQAGDREQQSEMPPRHPPLRKF